MNVSNHKLCFISAHCLTGKWETPFDPELTEQDDFNVDENTKVQSFSLNTEKNDFF